MPTTHKQNVSFFRRALMFGAAIGFSMTGHGFAAAATAQATPAYKPCAPSAGGSVTSGPCSGGADDLIWMRLEKSLEVQPALIVFRQALEGAPATTFRVPFPRGELQAGTLYSVRVPTRLCAGQGKPWDMQLIGSDGKPMGLIGHFTAECEAAKAG